MHIGLHVKFQLFLSDFNELWTLTYSKKYWKYWNINVINISPVGAALFHTDGRMDRQTWRS